jgi:hypothetical protein
MEKTLLAKAASRSPVAVASCRTGVLLDRMIHMGLDQPREPGIYLYPRMSTCDDDCMYWWLPSYYLHQDVHIKGSRRHHTVVSCP